MPIIYPDAEKTLVAYFKSVLDPDVYVATKHSQPDAVNVPTKELIINVSYAGETTDRVTRDATATLEIFANTYEDASSLAFLVESLIRDSVGDVIKRAEVRLGPIRTNEETEQERRSIDVGLIVKATDN